MKKVKVELNKILKICPGHFHCIINSNVGKIRKENRNIPSHLWDKFEKSKHNNLEDKLIAQKLMSGYKTTYINKSKETKLEWYKKLWLWLKRKLCIMKKYLKKQ